MSGTDTGTEQFHDLANKFLGESAIGQASTPVADAYEDAAGAVKALLETAELAETKLTEHHAKRDLIPVEGWHRQRREFLADADDLGKSAQRNFKQARAQAEAAILQEAFPKVGTDREALARQEYLHAVGKAEGDRVPARLVGLAKNGSPEVQAVLGTSFAKTDLLARGVANVDNVLTDARRVAAATGSTPEGVKASESLAKLATLDKAVTAANSAFSHSLKV